MVIEKMRQWASEQDFSREMPLSDFLRLMPNWLLDAASDEVDDEDPEGVSLCLAILHEALWSGGIVEATDVQLCEMIAVMGTACVMETQRRLGVHRYTVEGEDRLLSENSKLSIELNPAIMPLITSDEGHRLFHGAKPDGPMTQDEAAFNRRLIEIAVNSDWFDAEAMARE